MTEPFVTVWTEDGMAVMLLERVASEFGLGKGRRLLRQHLGQVLARNTEEMIAICEFNIALQEVFANEPQEEA